MRCVKCGHDNPGGSSFCLHCGSALAAPAAAYPPQTPAAGGGLPVLCSTCRTENPPAMRFCRNCGTVLQAAPQPGLLPTPYLAGPPPAGGIGAPGPMPMGQGMAPMGPMGSPGAKGMGGPMGGMGPSGPLGGPGLAGGMGAPGALGAPLGGPPGPIAGGPALAPLAAQAPSAAPPLVSFSTPAVCPRCSAPTQPGFAFCQQCGFRLSPSSPALAPSPSPSPAPGPAAALAAVSPALGAAALGQASTLAASAPSPEIARARAAPAAAPVAWGSAVSVNRDGTDGARFALQGEFVLIGRADADIIFEQDRFLARHHARLEHGADGVRVVPIDTLNGVFRKLDAPCELAHGAIILVGREVMRFEKVDADERSPTPLVRHGVALFGSPPREPWGRLSQLLPSGGVRDVRYLVDEEVAIGREEGDLVFGDDAFLSRRHCTIGWNGQRAVINDLGSSNGTFVRLTGPAPVRNGEHLRVGDQLFRLELRR
jgi:hypothetical protein